MAFPPVAYAGIEKGEGGGGGRPDCFHLFFQEINLINCSGHPSATASLIRTIKHTMVDGNASTYKYIPATILINVCCIRIF